MAGANTKQLKDNLANYDAQLDQVEAALTNDPDNQELLKLREDLSEVKQLTLDLLELAPEPQKRKEKSVAGTEWKSGEVCKAVWSENGKYYNATIDMIAADGETCTLTFDGYGTTEIVKLSDLRPRGWEDEDDETKGGLGGGTKRRKTDARANAKEKRAEIREMKKKKAQKKKERLQEIETFRESEKSRWQSFTQKSSKSKGALNGKQKKSIFAVPDSLAGRVGVGTCNIGGKGMTDFSIPSKTPSSKQL